MPGKLYDGRDVTTPKNGVPKNSQAYCDGMYYRASDSAVNVPKQNNPHQAGSEAAAAWDAGWDDAHAQVGGDLTQDTAGPCGLAGMSVVT